MVGAEHVFLHFRILFTSSSYAFSRGEIRTVGGGGWCELLSEISHITELIKGGSHRSSFCRVSRIIVEIPIPKNVRLKDGEISAYLFHAHYMRPAVRTHLYTTKTNQ